MGFQRFQIHEFQHGDVARLQHDWTSLAGFKRLCPATHTNTPAVTFGQAGKIILGSRRDEIIALQRQIFEKGLGDVATDGVQPAIFRAPAEDPQVTARLSRR